MLKEYLSNLANAFRTVLGTTDKINAQSFPDKVAEVYEAGYAGGVEVGRDMGYEEGHTKGYEQGEQAEYDRFWDIVQENGNRVYYTYAFASCTWNEKNFKPKYPMVPSNATSMFQRFNRNLTYNSELVDFTEICKMIDFSNTPSVTYCFCDARVKNITVDFSNAKSLNYAFAKSDGGEIENIKLKTSDKCTSYTNAFWYQYDLTNVEFLEGSVIAATISFNHNRSLNKESITSIMNALSSTTSGLTATFNKTAVDTAFETSEGAEDGSTSEEWLNLIATKSNWTITLS